MQLHSPDFAIGDIMEFLAFLYTVLLVAICLMLLWDISWLNTVCWVVIVVTTVYSGVEYFVKNHDVFRKAA